MAQDTNHRADSESQDSDKSNSADSASEKETKGLEGVKAKYLDADGEVDYNKLCNAINNRMTPVGINMIIKGNNIPEKYKNHLSVLSVPVFKEWFIQLVLCDKVDNDLPLDEIVLLLEARKLPTNTILGPILTFKIVQGIQAWFDKDRNSWANWSELKVITEMNLHYDHMMHSVYLPEVLESYLFKGSVDSTSIITLRNQVLRDFNKVTRTPTFIHLNLIRKRHPDVYQMMKDKADRDGDYGNIDWNKDLQRIVAQCDALYYFIQRSASNKDADREAVNSSTAKVFGRKRKQLVDSMNGNRRKRRNCEHLQCNCCLKFGHIRESCPKWKKSQQGHAKKLKKSSNTKRTDDPGRHRNLTDEFKVKKVYQASHSGPKFKTIDGQSFQVIT